MTIAQRLIDDFRSESAITRTVLEVVPDEHLDWSPHEKSGRSASPPDAVPPVERSGTRVPARGPDGLA